LGRTLIRDSMGAITTNSRGTGMIKLTRVAPVIVWTMMAASLAGATTDDFFAAIRNNDLPKLRELSRDKSGVQSADSKGVTPLHYASVFGSWEAMQMLGAGGADVNAAESLGAVP